MKAKTIYLYFFCLFLFGSCSKDSTDLTPKVGLNENFNLEFGQTSNFNKGDFELVFSQVLEDSRCPSDVICGWAGQIRIKLVLGPSDGIKTDFELMLPGQQTEPEPFEVEYNDYTILLKNVYPYPSVAAGEIETEDYIIELEIVNQ